MTIRKKKSRVQCNWTVNRYLYNRFKTRPDKIERKARKVEVFSKTDFYNSDSSVTDTNLINLLTFKICDYEFRKFRRSGNEC